LWNWRHEELEFDQCSCCSAQLPLIPLHGWSWKRTRRQGLMSTGVLRQTRVLRAREPAQDAACVSLLWNRLSVSFSSFKIEHTICLLGCSVLLFALLGVLGLCGLGRRQHHSCRHFGRRSISLIHLSKLFLPNTLENVVNSAISRFET
jgi:hypothetical protein